MTRVDATNKIEDFKSELGVVAMRQEGQNRPVRLVVVAGFVLVVSVIFLLWGISRKFSADSALSTNEERTKQILALADQLDRLKAAAQERGGATLGVPIESIRSKIIAAGAEAGMKNSIALPTFDKARGGADAEQQRLTFDVRDESLASIVRWIETAIGDTTGLEVYSISIKPEANQWNCKVTFSRWQWAQGT